MSILIVDDLLQYIKLIEHILKKGGFSETLSALSAEEAFEALGMKTSMRDLLSVHG